MNKIVTLFPFLLCIFFFSNCSPTTFSGKIVYNQEIYDVNPSIPEGTIDDSDINIYIQGDKLRTETNTMFGQQISITDVNQNETTQLLNVMGKKYALIVTDPINRNDSTTYIKTKEKKVIAGYRCKSFKTDDKEDAPIFYTKKIPFKYNIVFPGIKGYPIEYTLINDMYSAKMKGKIIEESTVDSSLFVIPNDYEQIPLEEFLKMLGDH